MGALTIKQATMLHLHAPLWNHTLDKGLFGSMPADHLMPVWWASPAKHSLRPKTVHLVRRCLPEIVYEHAHAQRPKMQQSPVSVKLIRQIPTMSQGCHCHQPASGAGKFGRTFFPRSSSRPDRYLLSDVAAVIAVIYTSIILVVFLVCVHGPYSPLGGGQQLRR